MFVQDFWRKHPKAVETMLLEGISRVDAARGLDLRVGLANALINQWRFKEARDIVAVALAEKPDHAAAHWCETMLSFFMDDPWPAPWRKLEARWALEITGEQLKLLRPWDGSPLNGKSILMVGEGGLGDEIQFVRFASTLKARGASQVLVCTKSSKLVSLFQSISAADRVFSAKEARPKYDFDCPMLSLPGLLGTTLDTLPTAPYLRVSVDQVKAASRHFRKTPGKLNVGLFWRSNRPDKSIAPASFLPLAQVPDVEFFGLGERSILDQETVDLPFKITNLGCDIPSTAAIMDALDLVISVDTMGAHLAGSLGRPVWLIVHSLPDWRWPVSGATTPWYPSMRIFRQSGWGWDSVIQEIASQLHAFNAGGSSRIAQRVAV